MVVRKGVGKAQGISTEPLGNYQSLQVRRYKDAANFIGFDFADTWEIKPDADYPTLRNLSDCE